MHLIFTTIIAVIALLVLKIHNNTNTNKEGFPFLLAALAAAGGGAAGGALSFKKSGAIWSNGSRPANVVSFYKDTNFAGKRKDYAAGAIQNSLSKGKFGIGALDKENDTYSSLQVPAGLQVQVWADNDAKGATYTFNTGDYPNLVQYGFHDNISSLKVYGTTTSKCNPSGSQFTTRVLNNGVWVCPSGWTDTQCYWTDGINGPKQCSK